MTGDTPRSFFGIDLCGPQILRVEAEFQVQEASDPVLVRKAGPLVDAGGTGTPFWEQLSDQLRLRPDDRLAKPGPLAHNQLDAVFHSRGAALREAIWELPDPKIPLVFVYPYRTPPVLRRYLRLLLGEREPWPVGGGAPASRLLVGLEAPIALAIEAVARRACPVPAELLLVTGAGRARELTAAAITAQPMPEPDPDLKQLCIQVRASCAVAPPEHLEEARRRVRALAGGPAGSRRLLVATTAADDLAAALEVPHECRVTLQDQGEVTAACAAAVGAIRFAGVRRGVGLPMLRDLSSPVAIQGNYPGALGVVGTNRHREWIWHRLFPPDPTLPTPETLLWTDAPGPRHRDEILLAECLNPAFQHHRWLHQDDWVAAGLSFHEHAWAKRTPGDLGPAPEPGLFAWGFKLEARDAHDARGLLTWSISHKAPASSAAPASP